MNKISREQADLYQDFFNFLYQKHNLICTIEEMDEIVHEAQTFVKKIGIANVVGQIEQLVCNMCESSKLEECTKDEYACKDCGHFPITK